MKGLAKLKIKFADATHISCAYCMKEPNGPFNQGYLDDEKLVKEEIFFIHFRKKK